MSEEENNENKNAIPTNDSVIIRSDHQSKIFHFFIFMEKISSSKYLRWLVIALLPVLFLLKYPVDNVDYDLWWHMALGKYYITHHTLIVDHSIFSWTPTDPTWIYNTCLGSIAIYLFYNLMGGFGLWILHSLVILGVFLSFYFFLRLIHQRLDVNSVTIIAAIAIACAPACRYYKPELFSLLLFCWIVFIFFYVKITGRKFIFYLYPLIFALWVNLHGAFVVGLVFLAMAFVGELLNRIFFPQESFTTENLVHFGIASVLSGVATLLNPYGAGYLISTYIGITSKTYAETHNYILAYISLWQFLKKFGVEFYSIGLAAWLMTLMIIFVFILSAYELIKRRSFDLTVLIISVALYWKGMETSRASYFFIGAFFFIIFYLTIHRLRLKNFMNKATVFSLVIFVLFFATTSYFNIRYGADNQWFGNGIDSFAPVEEVAFLKKYKIEGPIFNDYVVGGYLMWNLYPDYKVFIDPRCSPYMKQVIPDYLEFTNKRVNIEDIRRFRKKYPFKLVILHYRQMALIFDFLKSEGDEWRLLYFEKNAAILIHKSLLSVIKSEAGSVNLSPVRFSQVRNPYVLINVFNFYVRLNPEAGRYIYDIFNKNVSDYFKFKPEMLTAMDSDIKRRKEELEYKEMWLSP
jgi:hypothetical protein